MKLTPPKGTRDFYPEDMAVQNRLFSVWRETALLFGFEEYEGPSFEHIELFTQKSGEEIVKQLYNFKDKSDRELALRPEITPTLARMIAAKGHSLKKPVKWFSIPRLFRYERMQRGRLREFFQLNLDIVGVPAVYAEAEIVAAASHMLKGFGLSAQDFRVCVNSRRLMREMLLASGLGESRLDAAYAILDRRAKVEPAVLQELYREASFAEEETRAVEAIFQLKSLQEIRNRFGGQGGVAVAIQELEDFFRLMENYGLTDCVVFDSSIVRGLAYYTGIVFEIFDTGKTLRAIAGGGRYDNLVALFGGEPTPAVGFGMGDAVITELVREKGLLNPYVKQTKVYIVNFNKDTLAPAIETATLLRSKGIEAEFSLKPQNLKKQMESAQNARYVLFVGGEEWDKRQIKIKDMKTGDEKVVDKNDTLKHVVV
jgi:histidyl-tRNA synthetase